MSSEENISPVVWEYLRAQPTKIASKILDKLDYDICYFYSDGWGIRIERTYSGAEIPDYIYEYIVKHEDKILKLAREKRNDQ